MRSKKALAGRGVKSLERFSNKIVISIKKPSDVKV